MKKKTKKTHDLFMGIFLTESSKLNYNCKAPCEKCSPCFPDMLIQL